MFDFRKYFRGSGSYKRIPFSKGLYEEVEKIADEIGTHPSKLLRDFVMFAILVYRDTSDPESDASIIYRKGDQEKRLIWKKSDKLDDLLDLGDGSKVE